MYQAEIKAYGSRAASPRDGEVILKGSSQTEINSPPCSLQNAIPSILIHILSFAPFTIDTTKAKMNLRGYLFLLRITRPILAASTEAVPTVDPVPSVELARSIDPAPKTTQGEGPSPAEQEAAIDVTLSHIAATTAPDEYCNRCRWICYNASIFTYV